MNARMLSRLKRLETQPGSLPPWGFRWGLLKRLPEDYVGECHVVIVEREPPSSSNTGPVRIRGTAWTGAAGVREPVS
jgi:hypothetical protein